MNKKSKRQEPDAPHPSDDRIIVKTLTDSTPIELSVVRQLCRGVVGERKIAFLVALSQLGNRTRAARAVGVSTVATWMWRQEDDNFREAYQRCMEVAAELQEDEMYRRGFEGVLEPVFQGGRLVGSIRRFSDTCLIFGLKGSMPEKYADRQKVEHSGGVDIVGRLRAARERALGRGDGPSSRRGKDER